MLSIEIFQWHLFQIIVTMMSLFVITVLTQISNVPATKITEGRYINSDMACISCESSLISTAKSHCAIQCLKGAMCEAFVYTASQCSICQITSTLTGSEAHAYFKRIPLDTGMPHGANPKFQLHSILPKLSWVII